MNLAEVAFTIFAKVLTEISSPVRQLLDETLDRLKIVASSTPNKYDDAAVELLHGLLSSKKDAVVETPVVLQTYANLVNSSLKEVLDLEGPAHVAPEVPEVDHKRE